MMGKGSIAFSCLGEDLVGGQDQLAVKSVGALPWLCRVTARGELA